MGNNRKKVQLGHMSSSSIARQKKSSVAVVAIDLHCNTVY